MAVALFVLGLLLTVNVLYSEGSAVSGFPDWPERSQDNGQTSDNLVNLFGTQPDPSGWTATNNEWRKPKSEWNGYVTPKNEKYAYRSTRPRLRNTGHTAADRQCPADFSLRKTDWSGSNVGQWERPRRTSFNNDKQKYWQ